MNSNKSTFEVKDCAFTTIATGVKARTLKEFHEILKTISTESIYHHFWRKTIGTSIAEGAYYNDFSLWAHFDLHDDFLAERLTWINPTEYSHLEDLRTDMLKITKKRMEEQGGVDSSVVVSDFNFVKSSIVIFKTDYKINSPKDLVSILPKLSESSIFYHFIDARSNHPSKHDDFSLWLEHYEGFESLIQTIRKIDPYFISLYNLKQKLIMTVTKYFLERPII